MPSVFDKQSAKADPVEAAKLKRPDEKPKQEAAPVGAPPVAQVEPPAGEVPTYKRYRVGNDCPVHVNGCLTNVMKGQVLSEKHWGTAVIPRLREQGVMLEEIE